VRVGPHPLSALELQRSVFEFPQPVDEHAKNMNGKTFLFSECFGRRREQSPVGAELAFNDSALENRFLLVVARFAEVVLVRRIAKLMEAYMAVGTVNEWVVLFVVRTETPSAGRLEHSLGVLPTLLPFLLLHVLLELLLVVYELLVGVHCTVLLDCIQISKVIQVVYLLIHQRPPQILPKQASHVSVLYVLR
jgi:hypothetical protein